MKKYILYFLVLLCGVGVLGSCGSSPKEQPQHQEPDPTTLYEIKLYIAKSNDGKHFTDPEVFHEGGGVPSVTAGPNGEMVAVFQWFTEDIQSENFNTVAVKISEDNGETWTAPVAIEMENLPEDYQYPYDPTITTTEEGNYRLFFTTHVLGMGEKFVYGTAISEDGLHYTYEGVAFSTDVSVADGSEVWTGDTWYMIAPLAKQGGLATEATSSDPNGLNFEEKAGGRDSNLPYIGNLVNVNGTVRFYGSSMDEMWYISSKDLKKWSTPTVLNTKGGDPGIAYAQDGTYVMIYVQAQN